MELFHSFDSIQQISFGCCKLGEQIHRVIRMALSRNNNRSINQSIQSSSSSQPAHHHTLHLPLDLVTDLRMW